MTDGTSQGLFIVVAIVIFGIFVVMAYILFEDTLSPALASMFSDSISIAANYEQIIGKGETSSYYFGNYPLKNENEGMYLRYHIPKETDKVYIVAVYEKLENGELVQDSNGQKLKGHLELPDTIEGKEVVGLAVTSGTQNGNWTLSKAEVSSVKLPRFLETIPRGLFDGATNLKSIVGGIPESVTSIGVQSFNNTKLEGELTIPANVESIGNYAFRRTNLTKVIFKNKDTLLESEEIFKNGTLIEGLTNED